MLIVLYGREINTSHCTSCSRCSLFWVFIKHKEPFNVKGTSDFLASVVKTLTQVCCNYKRGPLGLYFSFNCDLFLATLQLQYCLKAQHSSVSYKQER